MHTIVSYFHLLIEEYDFLFRFLQILSNWNDALAMAKPGLEVTLHYVTPSRNNLFRGIEVRISIDCTEFFQSCDMSKEDLPALYAAVEDILFPLGICLDELMILSIDFCENVRLDNKAERMLIMRLLNKSSKEIDYAKRLAKFTPKNCNKLYWVRRKKCGKKFKIRYNVQLYDKATERKDKHKSVMPYEENVLRLEFQVREEFIKEEQEKYGIPPSFFHLGKLEYAHQIPCTD